MVTRETSLAEGLSQLRVAASETVISRLSSFVDLLKKEAIPLGFVGPHEGDALLTRHVMEGVAILPHLPDEDPIVDVGSGAGLPGLVLAALGRRVVLIESQRKRAMFLAATADRLGLEVDVRHLRAEDAGRGELRERAAAVVARALARPAVAFELCLPLVSVGGTFGLLGTPEGAGDLAAGFDRPPQLSDREGAPAAVKLDPDAAAASGQGADGDAAGVSGGGGLAEGRADLPLAPARHPSERPRPDGEISGVGTHPQGSSEEEERAALNHITVVSQLLGGGQPRWVELAVPGASGPRWVMIVKKVHPTPDRFPRRPGVPKRRPLGGDVASVNQRGERGR